MTTEVQRYSFHLSTTQRSSGTSTNATFQLKQVIGLLAKKGMFQVQVHGVTIPFSFNQLSTDISTIGITVIDGSSHTKTGTITLTAGNYNTQSVITELNTQITAFCNSAGTGGYVPFIPNLTSSYSLTTSLTTLSLTGTGTITLNFGTNQSLGLFFGFSSNATFSSSTSATGDKPAVANPVSYLLLRSPSFKQYRNKEFIVEKDVFSDILYRIPIMTSSGTYIQYNVDNEPVWILNNEITQFNIYLTTNLSYTPINLQSLDFGMSLTIAEYIRADYHSIETTKIVNFNLPTEPTLTAEQQDDLIKQRDQELKRLEMYKKKLSKNKDVLQNENGKDDNDIQQETP